MWRLCSAGCVTLVLVVLMAAAGCQDPLFPKDAPRSPYERYRTLRGDAPPQYEYSATGGRKPALRERLRPLGRR